MVEENKKTKKTSDKKTTKPSSANADSTGRNAGIAETIVRNQQQQDIEQVDRINRALGMPPATAQGEGVIPQPADQTPLSNYDVNASALGLLPSQYNAVNSPNAFDLAGITQEPTVSLAEQNQRPGLGKTILAGTLGALPIVGPLFREPWRRAEQAFNERKANDKVLVDNALNLLDSNPQAAGEIMKAPGVKDAFQRHLKLSPKDVEAYSEIAKNLPISTADLIRASQAEFGVDVGAGKITSAPKGERERQGVIRDSLEKRYKDLGLDPKKITDLDVATWDASSQQGKDMYQMQATREGIGLYNRATRTMTNITPESLKSSHMELQPIKDADGYTVGYTLIDLDDGDTHQEIWFSHMIDDLKEQLAQEMNLTPEQAATDPTIQDKAEKSFFGMIKNLFKGGMKAMFDEGSVKRGIAGSRTPLPSQTEQAAPKKTKRQMSAEQEAQSLL